MFLYIFVETVLFSVCLMPSGAERASIAQFVINYQSVITVRHNMCMSYIVDTDGTCNCYHAHFARCPLIAIKHGHFIIICTSAHNYIKIQLTTLHHSATATNRISHEWQNILRDVSAKCVVARVTRVIEVLICVRSNNIIHMYHSERQRGPLQQCALGLHEKLNRWTTPEHGRKHVCDLPTF